MTKILAGLFAAIISTANADNYEGYDSSIEGIGLWWLDAGDNVVRSLRFGEHPEFAIYCDGKNKLFIYEQSATGYACKTESWTERRDNQWANPTPPDHTTMRRIIDRASQDKYGDAGQSEYVVLLRNLKLDSQGIFTVSKIKLVRGPWVMSHPSQRDLTESGKIAAINLKKILREKGNTYKSVIRYSNNQIRKVASRTRNETYSLKIESRGSEVILIPTLYEFQPLGGDLISTVVLHQNERYKFLGHLFGCLLSVGADLDADDFPEVIVENCDNSEGQSIQYVKLFPKIKTLIHYLHN
jgi:hypothetical protein